ncbi:histone deacetylase HDT1-like [Hibiscus syriacus]|uniref:histone deacetylase HDT1-like n=1 Tax=Hibiscus syriacus TaxID=106335 RepID=UPI001921BFA9|nr:histone deacetylase HDT1-like [Hibiscus syriacus]
MEFWGIEVKAGQSIKADPGAGYVIHLSQASLGESKNKGESVPLYVNTDGKKLVLGTLSHHNFPQLSFDLVFDQEFELSHNWKNGSVYFLGYKTYVPEEGDDLDMSGDEVNSDEEEELPLVAAENGKAKADAKTAKANASKPEPAKPAVKIAEPSKKTEEEEDSEDEDDSDEMSEDGSSDDEDEETPKKVESSKKRPAEPATPASKKAKSAVTPQKTDGKKGGHTATPHPAKLAGKNAAKTPKSDGQFSCGSCNKSFGSEGGLDSHKKAKHGGK